MVPPSKSNPVRAEQHVSTKTLGLVGVVLSVLFFASDLSLPLGVAGGIPYIAVVLVSLWSPGKRATILPAATCTVLTVVGFFLSPFGSPPWMVIVNRFLAIIAIWVTAVLALSRKQAETRLRQAYAELEALVEKGTAELSTVLETALDGVITIDELGTIESMNRASEYMFGYRASELIGENIKILMPEPYHSEHDGYIRRYLESGEKRLIGRRREVEGRRQAGGTFPLEIAVSEFRLAGRRVFTGILRDISDRKEAQRGLIEQASLAKLGEMSAMVAHELKNPLAGISGGLRMLKRRIPEGSDEARIIEKMIARVAGLNDTVQDILRYARPRSPKPTEVPIHLLLEESLRLVSEDPELSQVEVGLSGPNVTAKCDVDMLKPVFNNLVLNAVEAMEGKGSLSVAVRSDGDSCPKGCFRVLFRDTGPGIPEPSRAKVFEPFFTTRRSGTGLGLAIAKRAVELHGGEISVSCPPEGGTEFTVQLPLA